MNDCTLLLNSYDGGYDLWEGFFTSLVFQWKEFNLPIVLNTESRSFQFKSLSIQTINSSKDNVPWGKRLVECLERIDTEFILFFLDDFWLDAPVDNEHFEKCLKWIKDNPDVGCISFQRTRGNNIKDGRFERFERRPQKNAPYKLNCQAALWRKEALIHSVRPHESPWEWEEYGSIRASRFKWLVYSFIEGEKKVFSYNLSMGGVIHRGKWVREVVLPLSKLYGLNIDFNKRGFWDDSVYINSKKRSILRGLKNRWHKFKSLI